MTERKVLSITGFAAYIETWTPRPLFDRGMVSDHLSTAEVSVRDDSGNKQETGFLISEVLVKAFEALRAAWGGPLDVTSGFRTPEKQAALIGSNPNAAKYSPHQEGMALDINADGPGMVDKLVGILRDLRAEFPLRIGWKEYRAKGFHFVHMDVCPFYYGADGPWAGRDCPDAWRNVSEW